MKSSLKRSQQTHFSTDIFKTCKEFGGSLHGKGNAKSARPLSTKHAMHVVLRSSLAKGDWSLRNAKNMKMVEYSLKSLAKKYGIKIYRFANVGNHIHLLIKLSNRFTFAPFMKAFAGIVAMKVTGAQKMKDMKSVIALHVECKRSLSSRGSKSNESTDQTGRAYLKNSSNKNLTTPSSTTSSSETAVETPEKFWDYRPWSRIVEWGKAFRSAAGYVFQNELEADGAIPYQARGSRRKPPA